ncbi:MAG: hypothetical protein K8H84_12805 [Sulfuricella denitrificans]|nr:hypothetical protein [Sulfuricella denitrificans]
MLAREDVSGHNSAQIVRVGVFPPKGISNEIIASLDSRVRVTGYPSAPVRCTNFDNQPGFMEILSPSSILSYPFRLHNDDPVAGEVANQGDDILKIFGGVVLVQQSVKNRRAILARLAVLCNIDATKKA